MASRRVVCFRRANEEERMSTLQPSPNPFPRFRFRIRPWGVASIGLMLAAAIVLVACTQTSDLQPDCGLTNGSCCSSVFVVRY